jgi:hypothetical protein
MRTVTLECQCCKHTWTMTGDAIRGTILEACAVGEHLTSWLLCQRDSETTEGGYGMTNALVVDVEE